MIKEHWWKFLGIALILYGFFFGILTPLKPGLPSVYPFNGKAGTTLDLTIEGYNTHFDSAEKQRVWLKLNDYEMTATKLEPISANFLKATFDLPQFLPTEDSIATMTLVANNEIDGTSVLPSAVAIKQSAISVTQGEQLWKQTPIESLFPYEGFAFPYRNILGETIRNIYFHVSLWFAMFLLLAIGVFYSVRYLNKGVLKDDHRANSLIGIGVVYGLLGCATGSIWAKNTWGTWWTTDVKLNMTAVFMLIYLAYFVLRSSFQDDAQRAKLTSVYNIFAFASIIPLLFIIPRLVDSLHPGNGGNPGFGGEDLDSTMRMVFYPTIIGMTLLGLWISDLRYRLALIRDYLIENEE
ncbi:MAG: cytochrome c biogenesis protein CcsA [Bacteroidota bacterium]